MQLVFDLDDTLIATRSAKKIAYLNTGLVDSVPDDFHLRPWHTWTTTHVHKHMQALLPGCLENNIEELPAMRLLRLDESATVLTSCSKESLLILRRAAVQTPAGLTLRMRNLVRVDSPEEKLDWLRKMNPPQGGIYFDNDHELLKLVERDTSWQTYRA